MVGCPGAQINSSVKSEIRLPASDCVQRDIAELQFKTWKLGQKGCRGGKKRLEGIPGSRRAPPYGAGQHGRYRPQPEKRSRCRSDCCSKNFCQASLVCPHRSPQETLFHLSPRGVRLL